MPAPVIDATDRPFVALRPFWLQDWGGRPFPSRAVFNLENYENICAFVMVGLEGDPD